MGLGRVLIVLARMMGDISGRFFRELKFKVEIPVMEGSRFSGICSKE